MINRRYLKRFIRKKCLKEGMPAKWAYARSIMFSRPWAEWKEINKRKIGL